MAQSSARVSQRILRVAAIALVGLAYFSVILGAMKPGADLGTVLLACAIATGAIGLVIQHLISRHRLRRAARASRHLTMSHPDQTADDVCEKCGYSLSGSPLWGPDTGVKTVRCQCPECGHWNLPRASLPADVTAHPPPDSAPLAAPALDPCDATGSPSHIINIDRPASIH